MLCLFIGNGCLGGFHILTIVINAPMNLGGPFQVSAFSSFGYIQSYVLLLCLALLQ